MRVRQARAFEAARADILMMLPPFFLKPPAAEVYAHSLAVGRAVDIPVMLRAGAMRLHSLLLPMPNHIRQDVEIIIASDRCRRPTFSGDAHFNHFFDEYFEALLPHSAGEL
jgi:hypothetical protein